MARMCVLITFDLSMQTRETGEKYHSMTLYRSLFLSISSNRMHIEINLNCSNIISILMPIAFFVIYNNLDSMLRDEQFKMSFVFFFITLEFNESWLDFVAFSNKFDSLMYWYKSKSIDFHWRPLLSIQRCRWKLCTKFAYQHHYY